VRRVGDSPGTGPRQKRISIPSAFSGLSDWAGGGSGPISGLSVKPVSLPQSQSGATHRGWALGIAPKAGLQVNELPCLNSRL
jgi:hypothetical protein